MPAVTDELITRISVAGAGAYGGAFRLLTAAVAGLRFGLDDLGRSQLALGVGAGALGLGLAGGLVRAGEEAGKFDADLGRASRNFKGAFPVADMETFTRHLEDLTGVSRQSTAGFLGLLGTFQLTRTQAQQLALPILNASEALKAQGVTTERLAVTVGKAIEGGMLGQLRRFGIFPDQARFSVDRLGAVLEALQKQGGDAASAFRSTLPGAIQAAHSAIQDATVAFGQPFVQPLLAAANGVARLAHWFSDLPKGVQGAAAAVAAFATGALVVYSAGTLYALSQTIRLTAAILANAAAHDKNAVAAAADADAQTGFGGAAGTAGAGAVGAAGIGAVARGAIGRLLPILAAEWAAQTGLGFMKDTGRAGEEKRILQKAALGAGIGAAAGSFIPGVGTGLGAAAGFGIGGIIGSGFENELPGQRRRTPAELAAYDAAHGAKESDHPKTAQERTNELLEEQNALLAGIKALSTGRPLSTRDVPGGWQGMAAMELARGMK